MVNYSNNKKIAKNTIILYSRSLVTLLIALYTSRIVLEVLGVEDYGTYNVVGGIVALFSMLSSTLSTASQRFITYSLGKDDAAQRKNVFSTCVSLHIVLGVIVVFILEVAGNWFLNNQLNIPADRLYVAKWVFQFSILTFFINIISVPYNAVIIAHERMSAFAYISIIDSLLKLIIALSIPFFSWDRLLVYAVLQASVAIVIRLLYSFYCTRHFQESRSISFRVDKSMFGEMFAFSGWNLIGSGSLVLRNQGIDILLNLFFGVTVNAAKGISNQVQNAVHQFVGNFTSSITPQLTISVAQKNFERTRLLVFQGSRIAFFMMMIFAIPIMTFSSEILNIWLVNVPPYTVEMVQLVMIYMLCDSMSRFMINSLLAYGDIRNYQLTAGGLKLTALPLAYIVLKCGGGPLTGVWVNIALELICVWARLCFMKQRFALSMIEFVVKIFVPCWLIFAVSYILSSVFYNKICDNPFVGMPFCVVITLFVIVLGLTKNERLTLRNLIRSRIKR